MANNAPDTYYSPVDFRIGKNPADVKEANSQANFNDLYDFAFAVITTFVQYCGIGTFDSGIWADLSLHPEKTVNVGNLNKLYAPANGSMAAGSYVSLISSGGVLTARLASASANFQADGWCTNSSNVAGDMLEIILGQGLNSNAHPGPLVIGQRYWLGAGGVIRTTPSTGAGTLEQYLGVAVTTSLLYTNIGPAIQH